LYIPQLVRTQLAIAKLLIVTKRNDEAQRLLQDAVQLTSSRDLVNLKQAAEQLLSHITDSTAHTVIADHDCIVEQDKHNLSNQYTELAQTMLFDQQGKSRFPDLDPEVKREIVRDYSERLEAIVIRQIRAELERIEKLHEFEMLLDNANSDCDAYLARTIPGFELFMKKALANARDEIIYGRRKDNGRDTMNDRTKTAIAIACDITRNLSLLALIAALIGLFAGFFSGFSGWKLYAIIYGAISGILLHIVYRGLHRMLNGKQMRH